MDEIKKLILFIILSYTSYTMSWTGSPVLCQSVFSKDSTEKYLNQWMAKKYPELKFVVADPDAFTSKMRQRFNQQKKVDPTNPHGFDYSELGLPLNKFMNTDLKNKIEKFKSIESQLIEKQSKQNKINALLRPITDHFQKYKLEEIQTALNYCRDLLKESDTYLKRNSITYRELVEFSYFYSRLSGHFDTREYSLYMRYVLNIDRYLNGYRQLKINNEYNLYNARSFSVYHMDKAAKGFRVAAKSFEDAFHNKEELETIWVPTNAWVERDILMRLLSKKISIIGVTDIPLQADGFLRPGGDFNNHDVRHESVKHFHRINYIEKNGLNENQIAAFEKQATQWWLELESEISKIDDPQLREAVDLMAFNTHHDRGYPTIPSAFLNLRKPKVVYFLYLMLKLAGEDVGFNQPIKHFEKSYSWLYDFWKKREQQEIDLILRSESLD